MANPTNPGNARGESSPRILRPFKASDRLDSWKEIAAYLDRDVTTVQRWEKREGMPVHRHQHDKAGSVYAFRAELDDWTRTRKSRAAQENGNNAALSNTPQALTPVISIPVRRRRFAVAAAALAVALAIGVSLWLQQTKYFWRNPIAEAHFQTITNFDGREQAAAVSRDGHFVAFLSDRDGHMDVWITQAGSGQFHNLTHGSVRELVNPEIRSLGFSPDASLVTFWVRKQDGGISVWAVPTLGGEPKPYLEGVAEFDWSLDGSRLAYHTPGAGDPLFVSGGSQQSGARLIFRAPAGIHAHFPLWSPDAAFIYFVQGLLPDKLDIWRIRPSGGTPERITSHNAPVTHPVLLDRRTLLYLVTDPNDSGPSLYSIDVERRIPHRLTSGPDLYTSLAVSADGRRVVATVTSPKKSLWRLWMSDSPAISAPVLISLTTSTGFSPRLGPNFLLYVSVTGTHASIWKLINGTSTELWRGEEARVLGGPAISPDGRQIAFSVRQNGRSLLYVVQADGANARVVSDSLNLQGAPAWAPDGQSIATAATEYGVPHVLQVRVDGRAPTALVREYSVDPVWAPDGRFVVYSGPNIGVTFSLKAATPEATTYSFPNLTLTRGGARHLAFLRGGRALVFLEGDMRHKNLWTVDLESGVKRQLTNFAPEFNVRDFDISPDGREIVLERVEERSDLVLMDLPR